MGVRGEAIELGTSRVSCRSEAAKSSGEGRYTAATAQASDNSSSHRTDLTQVGAAGIEEKVIVRASYYHSYSSQKAESTSNSDCRMLVSAFESSLVLSAWDL